MGIWSDEPSTRKTKAPAALREKSRDPSHRRAPLSASDPPKLARSNQATLPPPEEGARGSASGTGGARWEHRGTLTIDGATLEVVTADLRHDPRSEA
jgi:hypothetical protein